MRGISQIRIPAPRPAAATIASPARTAVESLEVAAAAALIGMRAAASSRPSMKSERLSEPIPDGQLG